MENLVINKDQLLEMLSKAYEQGYYGYLQSKDDFANSLLDDYISSNKSKEINSISLDSSSYCYSNYYGRDINYPSYSTDINISSNYDPIEIVASDEIVLSNTITTERQTLFSFNNFQ